MPLRTFEPLARVPGVRLFSLQKNAGLDQLDALGNAFPVTDLGRRLGSAILKEKSYIVTDQSRAR